MSLESHHATRVSPPPHIPRAPAPPIPGTHPHLGTPARGLPSDAPGTGSRRGPQSQAGTGTAPSPAAREACSARRLTGRQEGGGAMPGCRGLTVSQAGCKARVGWQPQGSQPPGPPRLQKWGAQRSQLLPTTLGRQAQVPLLRSQVQVPAAQWEARVPRGSQLQPAGRWGGHVGLSPYPPPRGCSPSTWPQHPKSPVWPQTRAQPQPLPTPIPVPCPASTLGTAPNPP